MKIILSNVRLLFLLFLFSFPIQAAPAKFLPGLPAPPVAKTARDIRNSRITALEGKIARAKVFSAYDELIGIYREKGLFDAAARLEREQSALYRAKKLENAAIIHADRAAALENQLQLFVDTQTTAKSAGKLYTGAALEPILGCYLGAFIDRDDSLGEKFVSSTWQSHRTPQQFLAVAGRNPGSLFMYVKYGQPFPKQWVELLKAAGTIPHIAWEPTDLNAVRDDEYLNNFAKAAREADWPIFFRFASEMNGFWTPYHGNPKLYREKFRLVNRVLHRHAPRAATIWCVNNPPLGNAHEYYPGDDGCDWVGVNMYSVPFHENRRDKPAFDETPLALLDPIYQKYSARKPIAICEFAASHQSSVDNKLVPDFAIAKLSQLYGALPLRYPRVKMINWFNMNTIRYPTPGKSRNNYLLTENPRVLAAWREVTNSPHFLTQLERLGDVLPPIARPLGGQKLRGKVRFQVWAKTFLPKAQLFVALDGKIVYRAQKGGAHSFDVDLSPLKKGKHVLTAYLYDSTKRFQRLTNASFSS